MHNMPKENIKISKETVFETKSKFQAWSDFLQEPFRRENFGGNWTLEQLVGMEVEFNHLSTK